MNQEININTLNTLIALHRDDPDTIEIISDALESFEKYHQAIYSLEIRRKLYAQGAISSETYREVVPELDGIRTRRHNVLLSEVNMLNRLADIGRMTEQVRLPNVGILCDYYHLRFEEESPDEPLKYPGKIFHTHIAKLEKRAYVTDLDGEMPYMAEYAKALRAIGYEGGISTEAKHDPGWKWEEEAAENLRMLKLVFED